MNAQTAVMERPEESFADVRNTPEIQEMWDKIDSINMSQIKRKLMLAEPIGDGLSEKDADLAILWYRRYLKLYAKYPSQQLVPSMFIDKVWHRHILDTRAYRRDCIHMFGNMLHHNPYFGMNDDEEQRNAAFAAMDELYIAEFGESSRVAAQFTSLASMCNGGGCDNCGPCDNN